VRTLRLPRGHAYAVAYAPDGRLLASVDSYRSVYFWDLASFTLRCVFRPDQEAKVWSVAFTAAGDRLALEDRLFDARPLAAALRQPRAGGAGPEELALPEVRLQGDGGAPPPDVIGELLGTPDGRSVVGPHWPASLSPQGYLMQWDPDGHCRRTVPVVRWVKLLAFTADGTALAVSRAGPILGLGLWDGAAGAEVAVLKHTDEVQRAAFTPDGRLLATAAGRIVRLWEVASRECPYRFRAFRATVQTLAFSPDGRLLAAGSREGRVRMWEVSSGREVADLQLGHGDVNQAAFAPDGQTCAAACQQKAIVVWDVDG